MTATAYEDVADPEVERVPLRAAGDRWSRPTVIACLTAILGAFSVISMTTKQNDNPFQDEGLYLYMGHRMIDHITTGAHLSEYPGTYFSGSPGIYPVLAASVESFAGVEGARMLSLVFTCIAIVGAYGIGRELFGDAAGMFGAASIALCGSIVFISNLATFDAMALAIVAMAAWLAVYSANQNRLIFAPVVGLLLAVAFLTKYAVAVYIPGICALAVLTAWPTLRWASVRRAYVIAAAAGGSVAFVLTYWTYDIRKGIVATTVDRHPISPAAPEEMLRQIAMWVGPWLALALVGAVIAYRKWPVCLVLLGMSVIGPLQQVRIGEATSLSKHVGFGLVFAAPLIGVVAASLMKRWWRVLGVPLVAATAVYLGSGGVANGGYLLTTWVDDTRLLTQLRQELTISPTKAILGEEPSAQRFALRDVTMPTQWNDTFVLLYGGKSGMAAYEEAIRQTHFGTIYLTLNTSNGKKINKYLVEHITPYRLSAKVPFYRRGVQAGEYLIWTPKILQR